MGVWEILLIIGCVAVVIGVAVSSFIKKKQGKNSCDCGGDCAHCQGCHYSSRTEKK